VEFQLGVLEVIAGLGVPVLGVLQVLRVAGTRGAKGRKCLWLDLVSGCQDVCVFVYNMSAGT